MMVCFCFFFPPSALQYVDSQPRSGLLRADQAHASFFTLHVDLVFRSYNDFPVLFIFPSHFRLPAVLPLRPGVLQRLRLLLVHLNVVHALFVQRRFLETKASRKWDYFNPTAPLATACKSWHKLGRHNLLQRLRLETLTTNGSSLYLILFIYNQNWCAVFPLFPAPVLYSCLPFGRVRGRRS